MATPRLRIRPIAIPLDLFGILFQEVKMPATVKMPACFLGAVGIMARVAGSLPVVESGVGSIYSFNSELGLQKVAEEQTQGSY